MIFYLHGFGSNSNSQKVSFLKSKFSDVESFDIPIRADEAYCCIKKFLVEHFTISNLDEPILVGTSLGGFWANYFAQEYKLSCLLMNPSLEPWHTLKLEHAFNMVPDWQEKYANEYLNYKTQIVSGIPRIVLLEQDDKILDYKVAYDAFINKSKIVVSKGGTHRYDHMDVLEKELRELINGPII